AKHFSLAVRPLAARAEALALPGECTDLVLTIEVLQFVEDDRRAVAEIARVLRRGGLWWCEQELEGAGRVTCPADDPALTKHRPGHSPQRLTELADEAGLRLVTWRRVDGSIARWWQRLESRIRTLSPVLHLLAFPALRALSTATANGWIDRSPATV